jgi:chitinase
MAFANSTLFTTNPAGNFTPFESVAHMRTRFGNGTKILIAIGGWGDTSGFSLGASNDTTRALYAKNVAAMLDSVGADGVDIDWEYPGGNGADYKQIPNSAKVSEITTYPLFLAAIREAIGPNKLLTIAVPGLQRDMIAFTPEQAPKIWPSVDYVNIMTYDLMNRRDNITKHHTDIAGSLNTIDNYLSLGLPAYKANLGFAFYSKYFTTDLATDCATHPIGCAVVPLENPDGSDDGKSGALTFEMANYASVPTNLTLSPDGSCGATAGHYCASGYCCSLYGFCGNTEAYCGASCLAGYGTCNGTSISTSWAKARNNSITDTVRGGQYYWDSSANLFWTWDTPDLISKKFVEIVAARGLGGVMAWSLGEDSYNWSHLAALRKGVHDTGLCGKP